MLCSLWDADGFCAFMPYISLSAPDGRKVFAADAVMDTGPDGKSIAEKSTDSNVSENFLKKQKKQNCNNFEINTSHLLKNML